MLIEIKNVKYTYQPGTVYEKTALEETNLTIDEGEFIGIVGHTGSGKSTLIQHLNALIRPTQGQIFYRGEDIWAKDYSRKTLRGKVGLVFQYPEYQLFENTVFEDVCFGPRNLGIDEAQVKQRAAAALIQAGIPEDMYGKSPFELSGGQKRRVAIAGILAMEPEVMVLDEPTAGLDPQGRWDILDKLKSLHESMHITVILVSHSMDDVAEYVGRMIVMNEGMIKFDGKPGEVFSHYKELESMHLAAPQVTYVLHALSERGLDVDTSAITIEQAKMTILEALSRLKKSRRNV